MNRVLFFASTLFLFGSHSVHTTSFNLQELNATIELPVKESLMGFFSKFPIKKVMRREILGKKQYDADDTLPFYWKRSSNAHFVRGEIVLVPRKASIISNNKELIFGGILGEEQKAQANYLVQIGNNDIMLVNPIEIYKYVG